MSGPGIISVWSYAWTCLSLYATLGIAWYLLDRHYGVHIYRWLYDLFHKDPMPSDVVRGVMFNQPTNRKVSVALTISTVQSIYMVWGTNVNLMVEIIMWLLEVPAMLVGFWIGSFVNAFLLKRSTVFDAMDRAGKRLESVRPGEIVSSAKVFSGDAASAAHTHWSRLKSWIFSPAPEKSAAPVPHEEQPQTPVDTKPNIDRYTRRQ